MVSISETVNFAENESQPNREKTIPTERNLRVIRRRPKAKGIQ